MAGIDAFGTTLEIDANDDAFATGVAVGELVSIDVLDVSVADYDVTTHGSPGQWREYLGGLKDGGELGGTLRFDPALHATILDNIGESHQLRITLPADADSATVTFDGYIKGMTGTAPHDGALEAEITLKVSGAPVLDITPGP